MLVRVCQLIVLYRKIHVKVCVSIEKECQWRSAQANVEAGAGTTAGAEDEVCGSALTADTKVEGDTEEVW